MLLGCFCIRQGFDLALFFSAGGHHETRFAQILAVAGIVMTGSVGNTQTTTSRTPQTATSQRVPPASSRSAVTYKGCLQGDWGSGFLLLTPTGAADSRQARMMTFKVVSAKNVDPRAMANKMVEVTGTLSIPCPEACARLAGPVAGPI
jgi:hypothetical protein